MLLQAQGRHFFTTPDLFIAPLGATAESRAFSIARRLRQAGYRIELESGSRGLKAQLRRADKLNTRYVLILGENELAAGKGTVRDMQAKIDQPMTVDLTLPAQAMLESIRNVSVQQSAIGV